MKEFEYLGHTLRRDRGKSTEKKESENSGYGDGASVGNWEKKSLEKLEEENVAV